MFIKHLQTSLTLCCSFWYQWATESHWSGASDWQGCMVSPTCLYCTQDYLMADTSSLNKPIAMTTLMSLPTKMNTVFLQDRLWISPWIKSISNELDIIIRVTIVWPSWHHHQAIVMSSTELKQREWDTGMMCKDSLCQVRNKIMSLVTNCFGAHLSVISVFISLVASQLRK